MGTNITTASRQWANRPDDQRYLSLEELKAAVDRRKHESWTATPLAGDLRVLPYQESDIGIEVYDPTQGENRQLVPTNWSFGQLAGYAGAPASYLRKLPSELAAINLQWGLEHDSARDSALVLAQSNGENVLRSMTSVSYGRIWDSQVVEAVQRANENGQWKIPAASYTGRNPKRATTLYASDRDVFIFLVDPDRPIEFRGEQLFKGFYTWNSEVGACTFGLATFLYRHICDNRIIWGAEAFQQIKIRHTSGAPERFGYEGKKLLLSYANQATDKLVSRLQAAQNKDVQSEVNSGKGETVADWLQKRGFSKTQAVASVQTAMAEEGEARSLWSIVNGITAYARSVSHTNERVDLETKAGKLLDLAA